jgi:hypothetical protein
MAESTLTATVARGLAAGAAGVTTLNLITYLDMAARGRPSSGVPAKLVDEIADETNLTIPGDDDARSARRTALGALSGMATGTSVAVLASLARRYGPRLPRPVEAVVGGALAMALSDGPAAGMGITDPRSWTGPDWLSDIVPHLGFGVVSTAVLSGFDGDRQR